MEKAKPAIHISQYARLDKMAASGARNTKHTLVKALAALGLKTGQIVAFINGRYGPQGSRPAPAISRPLTYGHAYNILNGIHPKDEREEQPDPQTT